MTAVDDARRAALRGLAILLLVWLAIAVVCAWAAPRPDFSNVVAGVCPCPAAAPPAPKFVPPKAPGPQVPERARQYQRLLTAEAYTVFGLDAPVAVLAGQLHQESGWAWNVTSGVGAVGLAQFMPATAADMARLYPTELGPADPTNPSWAIKAQVRYMRDLARAAPGATECDTLAFALASYNGGLGWLRRDQVVARARGVPADTWFGAVELTPDTRRAPANVRENRGYPRRILLLLAPAYEAGAWGRAAKCKG